MGVFNSLMWQNIPVQGSGHVQLKVAPSFVQTPPFMQGMVSQGCMTVVVRDVELVRDGLKQITIEQAPCGFANFGRGS